jgi:Zn-dependent protease with chaperone function
LVRRFIEPAIAPRPMVWIYLGLLVSMLITILGVSVFLFLFLAPDPLVSWLGTTCAHGTYCVHGLSNWVSFVFWLPVAGLLGWLMASSAWIGLTASRAGRRIRRAVLTRANPVEVSPYPVYEIADSSVFAWTIGIRRPVILVSQGLRQALPSEELAVVLAHEEAHAHGRDNLILLLSRIMARALFFMPGAGQALAGVRRSVEMSADAFASRGTGDRLLVAASVSRVARLLFSQQRSASPAAATTGAAFAHDDLAVERVQRLIEERHRTPSRRHLVSSIAVLALVLALFGTSLYSVAGGNLAVDAAAAASGCESVFK